MKRFLIFFSYLLLANVLYGQQGINYKAVVKDNSGNIISNEVITIQFSILENATTVYTETHTPSTDDNGFVVVNIGEGTASMGSFSDVDWSGPNNFLNVSIDIGSGLTDMGTTQFKAVPYALNVNGLGAVDEGNGIGWRLIGRNPEAFGNIGQNAVDLSFSNQFTNTNGAIGFRSFATGLNQQVSGYDSYGSGQANIVSGNMSAAFGASNNVTGFTNFASGDSNLVTGDAAAAIGYNNTSSNNSSLAVNNSTLASGNSSFSANYFTRAESYASTAFGRFNVGGGNDFIWVSTDPLFEIGLGTDDTNRSNALTILKNGSITAPALTTTLINNAGAKALVTKEYVDELGLGGNELWTEDSGSVYRSSGNVGVGTSSPSQKMDVAGKIKLADDANIPAAGTMRYNASSGNFEGFNGTEWVSMTYEPTIYSYEQHPIDDQFSSNVRDVTVVYPDQLTIEKPGRYMCFFEVSFYNLFGNTTSLSSDRFVNLNFQVYNRVDTRAIGANTTGLPNGFTYYFRNYETYQVHKIIDIPTANQTMQFSYKVNSNPCCAPITTNYQLLNVRMTAIKLD